jgi:hypothetical protein
MQHWVITGHDPFPRFLRMCLNDIVVTEERTGLAGALEDVGEAGVEIV